MNTITKGSGLIAAWKALAVHQKTIKKLHLRKLFVEDPGRGEKLKASAAGLFLEYSKNRSTDKTTQLLLQPGERIEFAWKD
jgi:glucose-6-phosphate isomerase